MLRKAIGGVVLVGLIAAVLAAPAGASHNATPGIVGGFEVDGDFDFDGLTVDSEMATRDWENVGNVVRVDDLFNSQSDNAFTQGSKENEPDDWVITQTKVSGKTDLTRAYFASEVSEDAAFLWLGFERLDVQGSGNAHVNFEVNKKTTTVTNSKGTEIPERSDGDILVIYNYDGGTGPVEIEVLEWDGQLDDPMTSENEEALFGQWAPKDPPPNVAFGDINAGQITRPAASPFDGGTVDARRFGEVGLDVEGVFGEGFVGCPGFGSFYAKSRASGQSIDSALEDLTPQGLINFSSCGSITVLKTDDNDAALNGATFQLYNDVNDNDAIDAMDTEAGTCVTGEEGVSGQCTFEDLEPGEYLVEEIDAPDGYVADDTVVAVTVGFQENVTVSHTFVNTKIRYRITLTPEDDSNLVDTDHQITALLERSLDGGATWEPVPDEVVSFSLSGQGTITDTQPPGPEPDTCTTDANGECVVTIHSDDAGDATLTASFEKQTATTPVTATDEAGKTWANYRILVDPGADTNVVDNDHTVTVTIERTTDGSTWEPVAGAIPDVSLSGEGTITDNDCADGTDADGQCTVTITSSEAGSSTITVTYLAVEGDTSREFSASGDKQWVDFVLTVEPDGAVNPIRVSDDDPSAVTHTFTVTLLRTEDGSTFTGVEGATPTIVLSGVGSIVEDTCSDPGTNADGECTVSITSDQPGSTTITATYEALIGTSSKTYTDQGTKFWEDYALDVTPDNAFNKVGEPHALSVILTRDTGSGFEPFPGETVELSLDIDGTDAAFTEINGEPASGTTGSCVTDAAGQCTVVINSTLPGTVVLTATWNQIVGEVPVSREDVGTKTYLAVSVDKTACPSDTSPAGGLVEYSVDFSVAGAPLHNAVVTDDLPPEVTFVSASDIAGVSPVTPAPGDTNGTVTWTFGELPEGDFSGTITVTVNEDVADGAIFTNLVSFVADEFDDPETDSHAITVAGASEADARAFGLSVDLLGTSVIAPTPDSDVTNPDTAVAIPDPFGNPDPIVALLQVAEDADVQATSSSADAIATAATVDINPGPVRVQASAVVAKSSSIASITDAGSSSGGSKVADLVIDGTQYGDITEPTSIVIKDPLTGDVLAEVHILEETPSGAAAGQVQPNANNEFVSGLSINGIRVVVHDVAATPLDESSEVVVSHAESSTRFASGLGCVAQPSVSGSAFALDVSNVEPDLAAVRVGQVLLPITGGSDAATLADLDLPVGTSDVASTSTNGSITVDPEAAEAHSIATIEALDLLGGTLTARLVQATSDTDLVGSAGSSTIADLVIGGTDVCATLGLDATCEPDPDTVLLLPGMATIVMLNEQLPESGGLTVNAVHIWVIGQGNPFGLPAGAEIIISSAHSGAQPAPPFEG